MTCPICASSRITLFHHVARVPYMQNIRCETLDSALGVRTGQLDMTGCHDCGFVWNAAFDPDILTYDANYENDQGWSPTFAGHVRQRMDIVRDRIAASPSPCVVEVGCGQGGFLEGLAEGQPDGGSFRGFDPAWRGADGTGLGAARIVSGYYSPETAAELPHAPDVLVSRHTIEHIADPRAFLNVLRNATMKAPGTTFLETPCANWIVGNGQVQDLFYEHCSIFTAHSLALALEAEGLGPARVDHVFGGQYLWSQSGPSTLRAQPAKVIPDFSSWTMRTRAYLAHWTGALSGARGPIHLWGAGSKGVIFALLMQGAGVGIDGVVDINPKKQNCFLPLTGVKVSAPQRAALDGGTIIIMNPAYRPEIEQMLQTMGVSVDVLCLT
jgi:SAM-dependent methyltransferase